MRPPRSGGGGRRAAPDNCTLIPVKGDWRSRLSTGVQGGQHGRSLRRQAWSTGRRVDRDQRFHRRSGARRHIVGQNADVAGDLAAFVDHQFAVANLAADAPGRMNDQLAASGQFALEAYRGSRRCRC
jgi:hypothetical protein